MEEMERTVVSEFDPSNFLPSFWGTWKGVITNPSLFFRQMPREGGFLPPVLFMLVCLGVDGLLKAIFGGGIRGFFSAFVGTTLITFLIAAVMLLFSTQLFPGKGSYEGSFRVLAYTNAVSVLGWIPVIGVLAALYGLYIAALGVMEVHTLDRGKAGVVIILTALVMIVLSLLLGGGMFFGI